MFSQASISCLQYTFEFLCCTCFMLYQERIKVYPHLVVSAGLISQEYYVWFQCKSTECLVSFKFLSLFCMGSFQRPFRYKKLLLSSTNICQAVNFFSHTYSSLHSSTMTKLTIKTYLQLISLKKKKKFSQSTIYKSFQFISSCSFRLKKKSFQLKTIHFDLK